MRRKRKEERRWKKAEERKKEIEDKVEDEKKKTSQPTDSHASVHISPQGQESKKREEREEIRP